MPELSDLEDGLIHWWTMNESSGLRIDHIGDKHLTNNGSTSAPGLGGIGAAAQFDNSTPQYLSVESDNSESDSLSVGTGESTINFFLRIDDTSTAQQFLLGKSSAYNTGVYAVGYNPPDSFDMVWNDDITTFTMSVPPSTGDWVMVTIYKNSSVYGITVNANSSPAETGVFDEYTSSEDFRIGGYPSGLNGLTGLINEVGFWNRRLDQNEIELLWNFYDENGFAPSYDDIITLPALPSRSDFDDQCAVGISCCEEYVQYSSDSATGKLPDCPTNVSIAFDPPSGSYVQMPSYITASTTSPTGTFRYAEFGLTPDITSAEYSEPILIESIGNQITGRVFYDECPPSALFGLQYIPPSNIGIDFIFTYHCSTPDNVGLWDDFMANGEDDNYWSLVFDLAANSTIDRIDIFQLDENGLWTTGSAWSTTTPIYPYVNAVDSYDPLPLAVFQSAVQINTDYDVPSPLVTLVAGVRTLELYGNPITEASGYFRVQIHLSTGEILYSVISQEDCSAGAPPASVCSSPPPPSLTPTCLGMNVEYNMAVGSVVRVFRKASNNGLGFVEIFSDTVGATPETFPDSGLSKNVTYTYYVSNLVAGCGWKDSAMVVGFPLTLPTTSILGSPIAIDPGDPITLTWTSNNNATVEITSDDPTFDLGVVSSNGNHTFDPGPSSENCWYMDATNSCGTTSTGFCLTVNSVVPGVPSGLSNVYTVSEVDAGGTGIFTQGSTPFAQDCTRYPAMFAGVPEWNGTLQRLQDSSVYKWEIGTGNTSYLGSPVPHYNITRIGVKITLEFVASTRWVLTIECRECTVCAILWQGEKLFGNSPDGIYNRTSGLYSGPATLTLT